MLSQTSTTLLNSLLAEPADQAAWRAFCERYGPAIFRFARRRGLDQTGADEVVCDTLAAFFEAYRARRYDRSKGRFRTWVFGIAMNKVRELRRRAAKHRPAESLEHLATEPAAETPDPDFDADVERTLAWQCLEAARKRVSPLTYQAFDLYVMKARSARDVARMLGIDTGMVYVAKSRVLSRARQEFEQLRAQDQEV